MEPRLTVTETGEVVLHLPDGAEIQIPKMKHNIVFVLVSSISRQYAGCEYRIHLDYSSGREVRREMVEGILEHARHLDERSFDMDIEVKPGYRCPVLINVGLDGVTYFNHAMKNRWIAKMKNDGVLKEPAVLYVHRNVPILAQPDIVVPRRDGAIIIELKTTSRDPRVISRAEELQTALYGYIFEQLGLNPTATVLVKIRRGLKERILDMIDKIVEITEKGRDTYSRDIVIYRVRADGDKLKSIVDWALDYWLYKRNPVPRPGNHCRSCQHVQRCPFSRTYPIRR